MKALDKTELSLVFCDNIEGWNGGDGRETPEGGDICMLMANSRCHMVETNTAL